jgi:hypothetical protein
VESGRIEDKLLTFAMPIATFDYAALPGRPVGLVLGGHLGTRAFARERPSAVLPDGQLQSQAQGVRQRHATSAGLSAAAARTSCSRVAFTKQPEPVRKFLMEHWTP